MSLEVKDERVRAVPLLGRLLSRPELGAVAGTVLIFVFFGITAGNSGLFSAKGIVNFLEVSAQLGILAAAVALLMIAGEFDLSVGSMIGFAGRLGTEVDPTCSRRSARSRSVLWIFSASFRNAFAHSGS